MRWRWRICALLLAATTINYIDRSVLAVLAPDLGKRLGWTEIQYGDIVASFQAAYALGLVLSGWVIDRLGTRVGYALAIGVWSLAAMSHALARTVLGFGVARFFLGLGEAGNFPAAIKTVAEWFPRRERALATGIFNAGASLGAILAPLCVPPIALWLGWQAAFLITSLLSATWLLIWWRTYRPPSQHPHVAAEELTEIHSDPEEPAVSLSWPELLGRRETWAIMVGKFLTDPVWWFLLFWLPKFFASRYGLKLDQLGVPLIVIYLMADVGSIAGGWLARRGMRRGWSLNRARKTAMLLCALAVVPIAFAVSARSPALAVGLIGLAAAGHQGWSANLFTLGSDLFPRRAVGSVVGLGGFAGAVGGMLVAKFTGWLLQTTGSYLPLFVLSGCVYLVALTVIQLLTPRLTPATLPLPAGSVSSAS
jgi:ACS family hexuronate transporter-like MFS transporter